MAVPDHVTVACVYWKGKFRDRPYTAEWVRRLRNMVGAKRFVCLTNSTVEGVETLPLKRDWPGWWSKIELFDPENFTGRVLYLDLDTLIVGDLKEIAEFPQPIAFMPPSQASKGPARYQTSCMVWDAPHGREIFETFEPSVMRRFRGDQDWIGDIMDAETMPPGWFNKLSQCKGGPTGEEKVVLSMPWKNREAANKFPWVAELWR